MTAKSKLHTRVFDSSTPSKGKVDNGKKSQHDCGKWVPKPHLTPPYSDFAWAGLKDIWSIMNKSMHIDEGGDRTTHKGTKKRKRTEGWRNTQWGGRRNTVFFGHSETQTEVHYRAGAHGKNGGGDKSKGAF